MCLCVQLKMLGVLAIEVAFVAAVVAGVLLGAHTHEKRSMIVGILCVIFGSVMYASPLTVMVRTPHQLMDMSSTHHFITAVTCYIVQVAN
jgi:ABC-type uncharacterized transport system permease subunit